MQYDQHTQHSRRLAAYEPTMVTRMLCILLLSLMLLVVSGILVVQAELDPVANTWNTPSHYVIR